MGPLYAYAIQDVLTWVWCLCVISGVYPEWAAPFCQDKISMTFGGYFCFVFVWGYCAGVNGLAGHELIHRKSAFDKGLGMLTYTKIMYSHFLLEHSSGHHRHVATPEDPATANEGEDFYSFAVRSSVGGFVNTYKREVSRLQMKYNVETVPLKTQLLENRMSWFCALHLAISAIILQIFGVRAMVFQLIYSLIGVFFIELINYTEHYGLQRKKDVRGIYEPINELHSWNAPSSHLLFRIQRHSDHHMHAYRPYQILRKIDSAPMMPYAYLYTLTLALCPPLWKSTMADLLSNKGAISCELGNRLFFIAILCFMAYSVYSFM
jgi:alkane 1-monooxygenase